MEIKGDLQIEPDTCQVATANFAGPVSMRRTRSARAHVRKAQRRDDESGGEVARSSSTPKFAACAGHSDALWSEFRGRDARPLPPWKAHARYSNRLYPRPNEPTHRSRTHSRPPYVYCEQQSIEMECPPRHKQAPGHRPLPRHLERFGHLGTLACTQSCAAKSPMVEFGRNKVSNVCPPKAVSISLTVPPQVLPYHLIVRTSDIISVWLVRSIIFLMGRLLRGINGVPRNFTKRGGIVCSGSTIPSPDPLDCP